MAKDDDCLLATVMTVVVVYTNSKYAASSSSVSMFVLCGYVNFESSFTTQMSTNIMFKGTACLNAVEM
jgi:hypothetical protein